MSRPPERECPFVERLIERGRRLSTGMVVGIDPVLERLPASLRERSAEEALTAFCRGVLEAVTGEAIAVKPQLAFFERHGWAGFRAFQRTVEAAAGLGIPVIADAKRGDIGSTAAAYADAFLGEAAETPGPYVDALTVNPYLGRDSLEPFLKRAIEGRRGLFVLTRTSNPGGADLQERHLADDGPLYTVVARMVAGLEVPIGESGYGPVGLVVGATVPEVIAEIRAAAPASLFLLPGIGAQGGQEENLLPAFDASGVGGLPSASRSILYPELEKGETWEEGVARAAGEHRETLETVLASRRR